MENTMTTDREDLEMIEFDHKAVKALGFDHKDKSVWILTFNLVTGNTHITNTLGTSIDSFMEWRDGKLIQDAFPDTSPEFREMLLTGYSPQEQENLYDELRHH
jgi:hypothetical protein